MTPEPSKQLRDIAPAKVPDELMGQMHDANQQLHKKRTELEAASASADIDTPRLIDEATEGFRKTEHDAEEVEAKIHDAIAPPTAASPKP